MVSLDRLIGRGVDDVTSIKIKNSVRHLSFHLTENEKKQFEYIKTHYGLGTNLATLQSMIKKEMLQIIRKENKTT